VHESELYIAHYLALHFRAWEMWTC